MDCATFKELAALFALGALDPTERAACEHHLAAAQHDGCLEVLSHAMVSVSSLEESGPPPRPRVWMNIAERVGPAARMLRSTRRRALAATSLAVACAAGLAFVWHRHTSDDAQLATLHLKLADGERTMASTVQERDACTARIQAVEAADRLRSDAVSLLQLPGTRLVPLAAQPGEVAVANAIVQAKLKRAYVVADGLPRVPDHDYELWVAKGKTVVAAGLVQVDAQGRALVRVDYAALLGDVDLPDAMMITLEPAGGGPVVRGPTVLLGSLRG